MDVLYQTKSASCLAPIDSERASIVMRLITKAGEFLEAGEPQQALQAYLHARDILDGLADGKEDNADLGLTLSLVYRKIGDLMRARGDRRQAKEAYRSSFAIAERLTTFHPGNEELQRNQAEAFGALLTVSDANGFGTPPDCANKGRTGCPILHDASAPASEGSVETPAERLVEGHSRELSLEVRNRTASSDPTGQLIDNVPRKMRVGTVEKIEVRIARRRVADAMTARLWAPDRGFLIEPLSAEICWPRRVQDSQPQEHDFACWKWSVMPQRRGRAHLHLAISAQTLDANGVAAEAALPEQVIKVHVRANYGRTVRNVSGWGLLMVAGAALNALGRAQCPAAVDALTGVWWSLPQ